MSGATKNIFLDYSGRPEERGPSTHIGRFGGTRPRDLNALTPKLQVSSPGDTQLPEGSTRGGSALQRQTLSARSLVSVGTSCSQSSYTRRDKPLLVLSHPKNEKGSVRLSQTRVAAADGVPLQNRDDASTTVQTGEADSKDVSISQHSLGVPSLEERFCLEDLRQLMCFFSVDSSLLNSPKLGVSTGTDKSVHDSPTQKLCIDHSPVALEGSKGVPLMDFSGHAFTSKNHRESDDKQLLKVIPSASVCSRSGIHYAVDTKTDLQMLLSTHDTGIPATGHEAYTRVLTEREFVFAVKSVIPDATDAEIAELMKKVDYEAKGCTTWDDFATFLVSQSRHRSQLSGGPITDLITTPEPEVSLQSLVSQHITGTCMEMDLRRNLLLTGGSEGSVRAWKLETLESCGVVFAGDCWVVSIHCSSELQCVFIVTMERKLIILDSKTLEVKQLYSGRAVVESVDGYLYAHDSVQRVGLGGKGNQKCGRFGTRREGDGRRVATASHRGQTSHGSSREHSSQGKKKKRLHSSTAPLSMHGSSPYVLCHVEECVLAGLVDAVSCSLFHHSALQENMLLFATVMGEVRFYAIPKFAKRVLFPDTVVRLHERRINKMSIVFDFNALLTASDDGTVKMTSLETGATLRTFATSGPEQHSAVHSFAVNTDQHLLVTVGPERYGIVWDFSHDLPRAILDSHNSPCRCCAMSLKYGQIFTCGTDGSIFIFNTQGFRLMQVIHVHSLNPQCIVYDELKLRLLCLAGHPYHHGKQHHAAFASSSKYEGHMATMIGVMYNKTYDSIITIDVEGLVITWKRCNGAQVFAFQLRDFSDSAVMNAARLTCYALDGLERRLLTGFQNGAVAVWNVVNGQTTNVITAAVECFATSRIKPEVTALGSLMRDGVTFFFFAVAGQLFSTRESSTFTIASATKWEVPKQYGEILSLLPTSLQIIVCGTSSGALIFYHFLAERQMGSALWVMDFSETARQSTVFSLEKPPNDQPGSVLTSRITAMFPLKAVGTHILMVVHADGTVALWHTLRRMLMGTVNVRHAFPTGGGEVSLSHAAVDGANRHFIFSDERGNIHVCSIQLRAVLDDCSIRPPRLPQMQQGSYKPSVHWPGSPFSSQQTTPADLEVGSKRQPSFVEEPHTRQEQQTQEVDEEKTPYVFSRFHQDYVFYCGFPSVSALSVISTPSYEASTTTVMTAANFQTAKDERREKSMCGSETGSHLTHTALGEDLSHTSNSVDSLLTPCVSDVMIVVSSGSDNFTRVFTLDGTTVGECGMNKWTLGKNSTYEFLGVKQKRKLKAISCEFKTIDFLRKVIPGESCLLASSLGRRSMHGSSVDLRSLGDVVSAHASHSRRPSTGVVGGFSNSSRTEPLSTCGTLEFTQADCPSMQLKRVGSQRRLHKRHEKEQQQEEGLPTRQEERKIDCARHHFSPLASLPSFDETIALSTHMRSRRTRECCLSGLVKSEYISRLRGLPLLETEEESSGSKFPFGAPSGSLCVTRAEPSAESPLTVPAAHPASALGHSALHRGTESGNVQLDGTVGSVEAPSQTPSLLVVRGGPAPSVCQPKLVIGTPPSRGALVTSGEKDALQRVSSSINRQNVVFSSATISHEEESRRAELIQGHMEAQRRMLRSVGGPATSALETLFSRGSIAPGGVASSESGKGTLCNKLLAARQFQSDSVTEARSHVAQITSRLRVFHVEPMGPPKGTCTREGASALKNKRQ